MCSVRIVVVSCLGFLVIATPGSAQNGEADYHRAYYLEVEKGDLEAAARLYEQIIESEGTPSDVADKARRRLAACREQLRSQDLSRLMPPDILAYVELRKPAEYLGKLLDLAQLSGFGANPGARGRAPASPIPFVVSPRLLKALEGIQGASIAITDIDPRGGIPSGVAVIAPGRNDLVHGVIGTMISNAVVAGELQVAESLKGHPTYACPFGTVVVTDRLIFAGHPRQLVVDAVERLETDEGARLSDDKLFGELAAKRQESLLFALVDAKRVKSMLVRAGELPKEYHIAQAVTDIDSLRWAALAVRTGERGIFGDFWMRLDDDNHAMAYHLLRTPALEQQALDAVPSGVAACLAFGLSDEKGGVPPSGTTRSQTVQNVTGLDIGREIFSNVKDVLAFVLPGNPAAWGRPGVPDIGLIMTVKDPSRSEALWRELLKIPATVLQASPSPVRSERIDDHEVQLYAFPESLQLYFAALPDRVVLSTSKAALSAAFGAAASQGSIFEDDAFRNVTGALSPDISKLVIVHAGRAFQMARPFLDLHETEANQVAALLQEKTVALFTRETPASLQLSLAIDVPKLGDLVRQMLEEPEVREIIPRGSEWKYDDRGADRGTAWRKRAYDDSDWQSGPSPLGYGEDTLGTVVSFGADESNKYVTTYFRRSFKVDRALEFSALRIHLRRDDGAAVFINGKEVARDNLTPEAAYGDFSLNTIGGEGELRYLLFEVDRDVLRPGDNTIAVEIHQQNPTSSDIVFDLALEGVLANTDANP